MKREAAGKEKAWEGAGESPGLKIWRIVKFKVDQPQKLNLFVIYGLNRLLILSTDWFLAFHLSNKIFKT